MSMPPPSAKLTTFLLLAAMAGLVTGCGGGGGTSAPETGTNTTSMTADNPPPARTLTGQQLRENNRRSSDWYADPQSDLPINANGSELTVTRADQGNAFRFNVIISPTIEDQLEPTRRFDTQAEQRLDEAKRLLRYAAHRAYLQWSRHVDRDIPQIFNLVVVREIDTLCGSPAVACYVGDENDPYLREHGFKDAILLSSMWLEEGYDALISNQVSTAAFEELFVLLTHEAGHQFGYENPDGETTGCGHDHYCHAPRGSGSVMSYDDLPPPDGVSGSIRYYPTEEDVHHIENGKWNNSTMDRYTISRKAVPSSIDNWGVWIDHYFDVSGQTAMGHPYGGNFTVMDDIVGTGWIRGTASQNVSLTGSATWGGQDNFLGVDLDPGYLGALLRADANLRYTFGDNPSLNVRIHNFEAHYYNAHNATEAARWHDHNFEHFGDFSYDLDCTADGCANAAVRTEWYANDTGDPSGWVGGVVNDQTNAYVGSFVAEKD